MYWITYVWVFFWNTEIIGTYNINYSYPIQLNQFTIIFFFLFVALHLLGEGRLIKVSIHNIDLLINQSIKICAFLKHGMNYFRYSLLHLKKVIPDDFWSQRGNTKPLAIRCCCRRCGPSHRRRTELARIKCEDSWTERRLACLHCPLAASNWPNKMADPGTLSPAPQLFKTISIRLKHTAGVWRA